MSILSESLERCLIQIQHPTKKVVKATVAAPEKASPPHVSTYIVRSVTLFFKQGTSDKEYHIQIVKMPLFSGTVYAVNFQYGRRGGKLKHGTKTETPVGADEAVAIYDTVLIEKMTKGYRK